MNSDVYSIVMPVCGGSGHFSQVFWHMSIFTFAPFTPAELYSLLLHAVSGVSRMEQMQLSVATLPNNANTSSVWTVSH